MFLQYNVLSTSSIRKASKKKICAWHGVLRYDNVKNPLFSETAEESDDNKSISKKHYLAFNDNPAYRCSHSSRHNVSCIDNNIYQLGNIYS